MKKVVLILALLALVLSCTPTTDLNNEETASCPAPDTNCNGIPDHEEGPTNSGG
jgi:hypothetical protein